jgi:Gpi18-like mannosyltransferase
MLTQLKWLKIDKEPALFICLLLFLNPYFFGASFLIYTDVPALCFALLGMYFYLQKKNLPSAVFFTLAVFTRQSYIFLPMAAILQETIYKKAKIFTPRILIYAIPFVGLLTKGTVFLAFIL